MASLVSKMYGDLSINFPVRKQGHDTIMHLPFFTQHHSLPELVLSHIPIF